MFCLLLSEGGHPRFKVPAKKFAGKVCRERYAGVRRSAPLIDMRSRSFQIFCWSAGSGSMPIKNNRVTEPGRGTLRPRHELKGVGLTQTDFHCAQMQTRGGLCQ